MTRPITIILLIIGFVLTGCAFDLAHVSFSPTKYVPRPEENRSLLIKTPVVITGGPCGYKRTLQQDTNWKFIGTIPEGEIYKPLDQVLTVECSNIFEAYLVISEGYMVGFYLPVEKGLVLLKKKLALPI